MALHSSILVSNLVFTFDRQVNPLISKLSFACSSGWTGIIGSNGCGKSTLLKLICGQLHPEQGSVQVRGKISYCRQLPHCSNLEYQDFQESFEKHVILLKETFNLFDFFGRDFTALSWGEKKRFQIAMALSQRPDILLLDEPTNHLDDKGCRHLLEALRTFKGLGVIVSHDREILNILCKQCIIFQHHSIYILPGNYSKCLQEMQKQRYNREHSYRTAQQKIKKMEKEINRIQTVESRTQKRLSKRNIHNKDRSSKAKIDLARLTSKDSSLSGKKKNLLREKDKNLADKQQLALPKDHQNHIFFAPKNIKRSTVLAVEPGKLFLRDELSLWVPQLCLKKGDKVALTGENGVGKSTFLNFLWNSPFLKTKRRFFLQQEIDHADSKHIIELWRGLDHDKFSQSMHILARLGAHHRVLTTDNRSPGEIRKIAIAMTIVDDYELLVLDEPTNHLDLPSMERLEACLSTASLALIMVSHDPQFCQNVCHSYWHLSIAGKKRTLRKSDVP